MAKYVNENVAQAIANDIQKNRVLLGAFDTVDTSNANYNLITRNTGFYSFTGNETWSLSGSNFWYCDINGIRDGSQVKLSNGVVARVYTDNQIRVYLVDNPNITVSTNMNVEFAFGTLLQHQTSTSYTEKVIKGVPILNLDQNGANWLRSEWEKTLQLWDEQWELSDLGGNNVVSNKNLIKVMPNTTYHISSSLINTIRCFDTNGNDIGQVIFDYSYTPQFNFTTRPNTAFIKFWLGREYGTTYNHDVMLNEGDHPYPHQDYNQSAHITNEQAELLKEEWEKGLNLSPIKVGFNFDFNNGSISYIGGTDRAISNFIPYNGQDIIASNLKPSVWSVFACYDANKNYLDRSGGGGDVTYKKLSEQMTIPNGTKFVVFVYYAPNSEAVNTDVMLNEGDHPYPYQPYSGAIVHEKDIENVAKTNVENEFSIRQKIIDDRSDLPLTLKSDTSSTNFIQFKNKQDVGIGFIGIQDYRPYFYTSNSSVKPSGELLTNNDIAELKSLVYDNSYPAVKNIKFNTFTALPNSIDGDSLIFGAGSDMTNIDGMSVVVNQLAKELNGTNWAASNANATFNSGVATFTASQQNGYLSQTIDYISGHVYVCACDIKLTTATTNVGLIVFNSEAYTTATKNWQTVSVIETLDYSGSVYYPRIRDERASGWDAIQVKNVKLADLTKWFGAGNEPTNVNDTKVQFVIRYLQDHPEFDTGHIESASPKAIVSRGVNVFDEELELGSINGDNGENVSYDQCIRSKNYVSVNPNYTYYLRITTGNFATICYYDKNKNFISSEAYSVANSTITVPNNAYYLRFRLSTDYGTTYNHDICINISNASINGTYYPYIAPKRYLINVGNNNSINGVNTIKDIMGVLDTNRKIGVVDLGSLSWTYYTDSYGNHFQASISGSQASVANAPNLCPKYSSTTAWFINNSSIDKVVGVEAGYISIRDTDYNDATAFKTAMSGVYLYYELATPYTEQNPQDANFPTNIEIQKGGSIEIESDLPCDITLEVAVSKVY